MSSNQRTRCARTVVLGWSAVMLVACANAHGPKDSTETGNPPVIPVINGGRVALVVRETGVHITGDPGAVTPGGSAIEITDVVSGDVTQATVRADGSFDATVDGSADDVYVVRATQAGHDSALVYVARGSATVEGGDGALSCDQRFALADQALMQAIANADTECMSDDDCEIAEPPFQCSHGCASFLAFVSHAGSEQIADTATRVKASFCQHLDGCPRIEASCAIIPKAQCQAGHCGRGTTESPMSCDAYRTSAAAQYGQAVANADQSCSNVGDCVINDAVTNCVACERPPLTSVAGRAAFEAEVERINREVCDPFAAASCEFSQLPCPTSGSAGVLACVEAQCQWEAHAPGAGCALCLPQAVEWSVLSFFSPSDDHSTLTDCGHYRHERLSRIENGPGIGSFSCEDEFETCTEGPASNAELTMLLARADVHRAFAAAPTLYGVDERGMDGEILEITVGGARIQVGDSCVQGPDCVSIPDGVQALANALRAIDRQQLALPDCRNFNSACVENFDPGSGNDSTEVYYHDVGTQACLPGNYSGSGGNANRYDSKAACEAQCGTPSTATCVADQPAAEICLRCGLSGGCGLSATVCALSCKSDADCESSPLEAHRCSSQHTCVASGCL